MTKSATRESADKVTFTQTEVTSAVALKAPIATPVFTGNVGIGVTPESDIVADRPHLRIGSTTALSGSNSNDQTYLSNNAKQVTTAHASGWEYLITDYASQYKQKEGTHVFQVAPSGSADAAISWNTAMTIDNAGIVTKPLQPIISVSRDNNGITMATNADLFATTSMLNWVVQGITHNTSNGRFTVPVAGKYYIHFFSMKHQDVTAYFNVKKNGSDMGLRIYDATNLASGSWHSYGLGGVFTLAANDYLNVVCGQGATSVAHGHHHMNFTISLVG